MNDVGVTEALAKIPSLSIVEEIVTSKVASESSLLSQISSYLFTLGGKRIRPAMTLLTARAFGLDEPFQRSENGGKLLEVAAGIELIHMATLLHDDIIDKSPLRRHQQSPFLRFGINNTLLAGDFLLVRAFGLCARLDRFIIDETEAACVALTEGEIEETPLSAYEHTVETSLEIARKKTAALFKLSAVSAGHLCNLGDEPVAHLARFGEQLGIAFQIVDDILDVTATQDLLGKRTGQDLIEKKPSIINVLWLQDGDPSAQRMLKNPTPCNKQEIEESLAAIKNSGVIARATAMAHEHARGASASLDAAIELSGARYPEAQAALKSLVRFVFERVS